MKTDKRPKTRGECIDSERPCPFISCRYHMIWLVVENWDKSDDEIVDDILSMKDSCVLDMAQEERTLEEIGQILGVTRERIRQISSNEKGDTRSAIQKLRHPTRAIKLIDFTER